MALKPEPAEAASVANCATCPFYAPPKAEMTANAAIAGIDSRGVCKFLPTVVKKSVEDWCGQHPDRRVA